MRPYVVKEMRLAGTLIERWRRDFFHSFF